MNISVLNPNKDPMGAAILGYQQTGKAEKIRVLSSMFDEDEIDVPYLFRNIEEMPNLEKMALKMAKGRILDVGAGAGCHALALQQKKKDVAAIDISPLSVQTMQIRGIRDVRCINVFDPRIGETYDTILLLMNGSGIIGTLKNIPQFFACMRSLLNQNGQVLLDSSDLKYLYENEDGTYDIDPSGPYYGEIDYQMVYQGVKGDKFDWLYIDYNTLEMLAALNGFRCEKVMEGDHYDYLAKLTVK